MHNLDSPVIENWWLKVIETTPPKSIQGYTYKLGYYWIYVQEIPNIECYRYLTMKGYKCNSNAEICMDKEGIDEYIALQYTIMEEKDD